MSSSMSCMLALRDANGNYAFDVNNIESLRQFINNHHSKYLKSPSGDLWIVDTYDFQKQYTDDYYDRNLATQPTTISFSWEEIENPDVSKDESEGFQLQN